MPDMIVPLLDIPDPQHLLRKLESEGITIRNARPWEQDDLNEFMMMNFNRGWSNEASVGFANKPISILLALEGEKIVGFAAYEVTARAFFGPTGVDEAYRGRGIGKALLLESLAGLRSLGYVYGFIGSPGPVEFYEKAVKCMLLPEDYTSIYRCRRAITIF